MERSFKPEYFILLDEPEMVRLVTAHNRNEFQPELRAFLQAMCRMGALRSLSLQRSDHEWIPPEFTVNEQDEIRDNSGNIP